MKRFLPVLIGMFLCLYAAKEATAQVKGFAAGPKAGLYLNKGKFMIGGVGEFPFAPNLFFEPGVELVFGITNTTRLIGDANIRMSFVLRGVNVEPFLLGGLGGKLDIYSTENETFTDTGFRLNVGGGATFNSRSPIQPWAGIKIYFLDKEDSDVLLQAGVNVFL